MNEILPADEILEGAYDFTQILNSALRNLSKFPFFHSQFTSVQPTRKLDLSGFEILTFTCTFTSMDM